MKSLKFLPLLLILIAGCTPEKTEQNDAEIPSAADGMITKAVAEVNALGDRNINGTVSFEEAEGGVLVTATVYGLEAGKHGIHIHQYGDCTAADGSSAGGHYNPEGHEHGSPEEDNRHMGDLGNIVSVGGEVATLEYTDNNIDLQKIAGRGLILHAGADDLSSLPSGDAGSRIACGVIGIHN